ncbi:MAG: pilus assembly protein PilZ [Legionellales bacterium]|nr:pilus assembly protein PilZ [Legionellales bacterium]|tara:strand:- start:22798 stop:23250 length:453 start_codon:yes stop_codon:yes gene_type:complete
MAKKDDIPEELPEEFSAQSPPDNSIEFESVDFDEAQVPEDKSSVFFINLKGKDDLYHAYMPYIMGGGLFIQTEKIYTLGDEVFILLKLMDDPEKYTIAGRIVWITPKAAQGGRPAGIGVQFVGEDTQDIRNKIETLLAGALQSDRTTDTM